MSDDTTAKCSQCDKGADHEPPHVILGPGVRFVTDMSDTNEVGSETHYVVHCPDNGGPHDYVVVKGDPINGTVVGHYPTFTVARAAACMTDVEEWAKSVYMPRDDINAFIANLQRIPSSLLLAHLLTDNQT